MITLVSILPPLPLKHLALRKKAKVEEEERYGHIPDKDTLTHKLLKDS